jgi:hypothetical protein
MCNEMVLFLNMHKCKPEIIDRRQKDLDKVVSETISTFEDDLAVFWNSKDVKFAEYWLNKRKKDEKGPESA